MRLSVPLDQAAKLIGQIPHRTCQNAIQRCWIVAEDGTVAEESVNWLFCWGKTGLGSSAAADEARRIFETVLPVSFSQYDQLVDHEYARANRYGAKGRKPSIG
jgi:hypothetical protein